LDGVQFAHTDAGAGLVKTRWGLFFDLLGVAMYAKEGYASNGGQ
jgi:hypothetical protein